MTIPDLDQLKSAQRLDRIKIETGQSNAVHPKADDDTSKTFPSYEATAMPVIKHQFKSMQLLNQVKILNRCRSNAIHSTANIRHMTCMKRILLHCSKSSEAIRPDPSARAWLLVITPSIRHELPHYSLTAYRAWHTLSCP